MSRRSRLERLEQRPQPDHGSPPWDELTWPAGASAYWDTPVTDDAPDVLELMIELAGRGLSDAEIDAEVARRVS